MPRGSSARSDDNEAIEFSSFADALTAVEQTHNFIVVDTAGSDTHLTRLAHSMADTLITPLNDSFVDFAVLGTVDPATYTVTGESHYAKMVREARQQRRLVDGVLMDWVVVRNRLSMLDSRNMQRIIVGHERSGDAARFPQHRRAGRARDLSRILPARPHRARQSRRARRWAPAPTCRTSPRAAS